MGIFSSKKKTKVFTSVSRMVEDSNIVTSAQSAVVDYVLNATLQTETDIETMSLTDHIRKAQLNSVVAKMDSFYRHAKSGNYYYGLPKASVVYPSSNALTYEVQRLMESKENAPVSVRYAHIGAPNFYHFTVMQLVERYDYNPYTQAIRGGVVTNIILHYSEATYSQVTDSTYFDAWDADAEDFVVGGVRDYALVELASGKTIEITFEDYIASGVEDDSVMGSMNETIDSTINEMDYVMGCYEFTRDGQTIRKYLTYVFGSGTYPTLDNIYSAGASTGQYYPRMYVRLDNKNLADDSRADTEAYISSMRAAKKMDLVWNEWVNQIHDNIEDSGNLQQVFVQLALPANSRDQRVHEYMFKYFNRMYASSTSPVIEGDNRAVTQEYAKFAVKAGASIVIADNAFTQILSYSAIGVRDTVGVVANVGAFSMERGTSYTLGVSRPYHAYRKQLTANTYREVRVYNLSLTEEVGGGKSTVSTTDSENLIVPIDRVVAGEFSSKDKEYLYSAGLHIVFNTLQVVKTKWYQTGIFKVVMFVAAVVFAVWTGGGSLTLASVATAVAEVVLVNIAIQVVAKIAVKLGVNVVVITAIAVVAAAFAGYMRLNNIEGVGGLTAQNLMSVSNEALKHAPRVAQEELKVIAEDADNLQTTHKEKEQSLEDLKAELWTTPSLIEPSLFITQQTVTAPKPNLYQTPNDYYTTAIHTGNPGVLCYDIVANYVSNALTLPYGVQTIPSIQGA